jgi:hypothetical protein
VEYTTISQVALEIEGVDEEPVEQSPLRTVDDDVKVDNGIDDDNLDTTAATTEVDNDVDDNLDADHNDDAPLHFRSINDILKTTRFAPRALVAEELHLVSSDELASFTEVEHSPS